MKNSVRKKSAANFDPSYTGAFGNFFDIGLVVFVVFFVAVLLGDKLEAHGMPHFIVMAGRLSLFVFVGAVFVAMAMDSARRAGATTWRAQAWWLIKRILICIAIVTAFLIGSILFIALAVHFR